MAKKKQTKKQQYSLQRIRKNSILTLLSQVLALQSKSLGENDLDNHPNVVLIFDNEEQKKASKDRNFRGHDPLVLRKVPR